MMRMWMWFGYDLGPFLFEGLDVTTRWQFALTWIALFIVAVLFEGSKVYLARVQRAAMKKLYPFRSDERRNLLCRDPTSVEPSTSRNTSDGPVGRWSSLQARVLVNSHQSLVFVIHNTVGYLLMLSVMVYNVELLLAVVLGTMLGYFLFGSKLTRLQMQCFRTKRVVICTPECDDSAESTTPPHLEAATFESDYFICQTRTCIRPSHYFRAGTSQEGAACNYGAKPCPSKVAKAKKLECHHEKDKSAQDQLLGESCCKENVETSVVVHQPTSCCKEDGSSSSEQVREDSPQITCCHSKTTPSESQEKII